MKAKLNINEKKIRATIDRFINATGREGFKDGQGRELQRMKEYQELMSLFAYFPSPSKRPKCPRCG